eukprot:TRINITY_DN8584_c2_g1_i2.p2 TRINITY_DN8584_c2_g1~~TRINITY_DN8584_c2_g1_i2.p2  ORF type:complete len:109 (-),score=8.96 TRINITY_DN8584_c2_g1_i2:61-387(-)
MSLRLLRCPGRDCSFPSDQFEVFHQMAQLGPCRHPRREALRPGVKAAALRLPSIQVGAEDNEVPVASERFEPRLCFPCLLLLLLLAFPEGLHCALVVQNVVSQSPRVR